MIRKTEHIAIRQMRPPEHGFSLISAIFLLVVIAALSTFAVTLSATQQQNSALDALGSRAYQAARAGVEWGAFQITQSGVVGTGFATDCRSSSTLHVTASQPALPAGTQLSVFGVGVTCGAGSYIDNIDGVTPTWVYQVVSTASGVEGAVAGSPNYVERQIRVTVAQ